MTKMSKIDEILIMIGKIDKKMAKNAENRPIFVRFPTIFGNYLGNETKYKKMKTTVHSSKAIVLKD